MEENKQVASYEIYPEGTVLEYVLFRYDQNDEKSEVLKKGKVVTFDEKLGKYHVAEKLGNNWTVYGFYYVHPRDVRGVVDE